MPAFLLQKPFISLLFARVCLSLTSTVLSVAIGWHLYEATGDAFDLALVGLMQILPVISLFVLTGWVIDNVNRKTILLCCSALQLLVMLGLALALKNGVEQTWPIFTLVFFNGVAGAFASPSMHAILPNIVGKKELARAVAISGTCWTSAMTAGPFVAGLLIASLNFKIYWLLVANSALAFLLLTQLPAIPVLKPTQRGLHQLLEGARFVAKNPIVLPSISLDLFIVFLGSVTALLPIIVADVLHAGPEALGLLRAMPALGAVVVGALLSGLREWRFAGQWLFVALLVFSLSILVFAVSTSLWLSAVALFIYGGSDMVSVNIRSTLVQLATPDNLRGRVSAVNSLFIASSNDAGDFRAGASAALLGAAPAALMGGFMALLVTAIGYGMCKTLRRLDRLHDAVVED